MQSNIYRSNLCTKSAKQINHFKGMYVKDSSMPNLIKCIGLTKRIRRRSYRPRSHQNDYFIGIIPSFVTPPPIKTHLSHISKQSMQISNFQSIRLLTISSCLILIFHLFWFLFVHTIWAYFYQQVISTTEKNK